MAQLVVAKFEADSEGSSPGKSKSKNPNEAVDSFFFAKAPLPYLSALVLVNELAK